MKISDITGAIEEYAPLWLQEEWDNAGVQVGDTAIEATGALLCVDATEAIVDEAIGRGINLIVSHHPLIFHGLKRITGRTATERIVAKALRHGITIYSAHTNMDSAPDGVSWATGKLVGLTDMRTLMPQQGRLMKLSVFTPTEGKAGEPVAATRRRASMRSLPASREKTARLSLKGQGKFAHDVERLLAAEGAQHGAHPFGVFGNIAVFRNDAVGDVAAPSAGEGKLGSRVLMTVDEGDAKIRAGGVSGAEQACGACAYDGGVVTGHGCLRSR